MLPFGRAATRALRARELPCTTLIGLLQNGESAKSITTTCLPMLSKAQVYECLAAPRTIGAKLTCLREGLAGFLSLTAGSLGRLAYRPRPLRRACAGRDGSTESPIGSGHQARGPATSARAGSAQAIG